MGGCGLKDSFSDHRYTLLVGKPPFETSTLKETYMRIKRNEYRIPSHVSPEARELISRLLLPDPSQRPPASKVLADPFFSSGYVPARLPVRYEWVWYCSKPRPLKKKGGVCFVCFCLLAVA